MLGRVSSLGKARTNWQPRADLGCRRDTGETGAMRDRGGWVSRGAGGPGPIFAPDGNYQFTITAVPGDHLSFASMFVQSNDWFFGLDSLPLFDAVGNPRSGNISGYVTLYDAGTEVDEALGYGAHQAPRQAGPNSGASQGSVIGPTGHPAGGNIHVTITPQ